MSSSGGPSRPLPASNRILAAGWQAQQHAAHQARLANMKPVTDSAPPACAKVRLNWNKKRLAHEADLQRIDRENRILLERMSLIQSKPSPDLPTAAEILAAAQPVKPNGVGSQKSSLNSYVRRAAQERILEENQALVKRLKGGRGYFTTDEFSRHEREYKTLKDNASIARSAPAPMPAPKYQPQSHYTPQKLHAGGDSNRSDRSSSSTLSRSQSVTAILGASPSSKRPLSSGPTLGSSSSSKSLSLAPLSRTAKSRGRSPPKPTRPLAETQDENGPVKSILSDTYPNPNVVHRAASHHTVQLKQDGRKHIDGRSVMVTVEEMTAVASESNASSGDLLHTLLFRTYDHVRFTHDFVGVPWSIISNLPELQAEPKLLDPEQREQMAERLFGRLRFHEGRLAFNPSRALRIDGQQEPAQALTPLKTPAKKKRTSSSTSSSTQQAKSSWDQITADGKLNPTAAPAADEEDADAPLRPISPDLGVTPRSPRTKSKSPTKRVGPLSTHHLSTTTATLVRAGASALMVEASIRHRHEEAARKKEFAAHRTPQRDSSRSRSTSPQRLRSPQRALSPERPAEAEKPAQQQPSQPQPTAPQEESKEQL